MNPVAAGGVGFCLFNPLTWIAIYILYRVFFTEPGRPPLHENDDE